ncbi:hypothetical protein GCM10010211_66150 [Streptomyces albospinus]|uniref:Uncharacterized protein n=1 Tax=Streptomyces albospinus TaxID=285515 RepID=A0ABQ2VJ09_9ACTN|nr:hypothetical protein GCM10010211_66150 [Streptomyces albospinus]
MPRQHRLPEPSAHRGTVALARNNSALYPGSAVGSAPGGLAPVFGPAPSAPPRAAAGPALHLAAGRRSRRAARVSTLGCYEHS